MNTAQEDFDYTSNPRYIFENGNPYPWMKSLESILKYPMPKKIKYPLLYNYASTCHWAGFHEKALQIMEDVLSEHKRSSNGLFAQKNLDSILLHDYDYLFAIHHELNNINLMQEYYEKMNKIAGGFPLLFPKAILAYYDKKYEESRDYLLLYQKELNQDPNHGRRFDISIHYELGRIYTQLKEFDKSHACYTFVLNTPNKTFYVSKAQKGLEELETLKKNNSIVYKE